MYSDRDFDMDERVPAHAADLTQDLELNTLFAVMAAGDAFLLKVARKAVLTSLREPEAIRYRQDVLRDCLERPAIVNEIYSVAVEAIEREKRVWRWASGLPQGTLHRAIEVLQIFVDHLKRLKRIADEQGAQFRSAGFSRFFRMLTMELGEEYLSAIDDHLRRLEFRNGLLMSAGLGKGLKGTNYVLRKLPESKRSWTERLQGWLGQLAGSGAPRLVYEIADRDEAGFQALSELRDHGIGHVAAALAQSTDHILSFFSLVRSELAFYLGCLRLRDELSRRGEPISFPEPLPAGQAMLAGRGLYDACLSLSMEGKIVANDVNAEDKALVMMTGANRGGKSTFLRSVGVAQLMMQCGMFVPAEFFRANICAGVFTHFKREEDAGMRRGKLDEELARMSSIVDHLTPNSMILLNESFASTNEREGSEIARQIVRALLEAGIKVLYVTHLFDLAQGFYFAKMETALFLRAERLADGRRTFRILEGKPLPTSYGEDLYQRIFAGSQDQVAATCEEPDWRPSPPSVSRGEP
jgi:MutS domain V